MTIVDARSYLKGLFQFWCSPEGTHLTGTKKSKLRMEIQTWTRIVNIYESMYEQDTVLNSRLFQRKVDRATLSVIQKLNRAETLTKDYKTMEVLITSTTKSVGQFLTVVAEAQYQSFFHKHVTVWFNPSVSAALDMVPYNPKITYTALDQNPEKFDVVIHDTNIIPCGHRAILNNTGEWTPFKNTVILSPFSHSDLQCAWGKWKELIDAMPDQKFIVLGGVFDQAKELEGQNVTSCFGNSCIDVLSIIRASKCLVSVPNSPSMFAFHSGKMNLLFTTSKDNVNTDALEGINSSKTLNPNTTTVEQVKQLINKQ